MINRYKLLRDERKQLQFLQALGRLKQNQDFTLLVEVLEEAQRNVDKANRTATFPELERGQGTAIFLEELLSTIGTAESQGREMRKQHESKETPAVSGF